MILIVDFDDVLFDAAELKEKFFSVLEAHGVKNPRDHYTYERANDRPFSLRGFLNRVCKEEGVTVPTEELYEEIMSVCHELRNEELVTLMADVGKESTYIVTSGEEEFQRDKIARSGIGEHAKVIIVVPGSKKEAIENICKQFPNETVIFVDDKVKFFSDLDMAAHPNLKTILYTNHDVRKVVEEEIQNALQAEYVKSQQMMGVPKMR